MPMSEKYPFGFNWTGYTNLELLDVAHSDMQEFDRQDLKIFIEVLAGRLEKFIEKCDSSKR